MKKLGRRIITRHGEPVTLHYWDVDHTTEDGHGDPIETEYTIETTAVFDQTGSFTQELVRALGTESEAKTKVYVHDEVATEIGAHRPNAEMSRSPEIVRHLDQSRHRVASAFDERNGVITCDTTQIGFDENE